MESRARGCSEARGTGLALALHVPGGAGRFVEDEIEYPAEPARGAPRGEARDGAMPSRRRRGADGDSIPAGQGTDVSGERLGLIAHG